MLLRATTWTRSSGPGFLAIGSGIGPFFHWHSSRNSPAYAPACPKSSLLFSCGESYRFLYRSDDTVQSNSQVRVSSVDRWHSGLVMTDVVVLISMNSQFRIRTLLIATAVVAAACYLASPFFEAKMIAPSRKAREMADGIPRNTADRAEAAIAKAGLSGRAIVFLGLDWSATSVIGSHQFAQYRLGYQDTNPGIKFQFIDITPLTSDYSALEKLPGWTQILQANSGYPITGSGEVVWIRDQTVVHVQSIFDFRSTAELNRLTEKLFKE